jgi:HEAT repeat protein
VRAVLACLALLAGAAAAEPPAAAPPAAAESTALIEALEAAPLGVVGTIEGRSALDARSWRATLRVESVLVGEAGAAPLAIAWEELASARPPRFANGDRLLLALEPLPAGSLWRQRFGDPTALLAVRGVAQRGTAFLRSPSLGSLAVLRHYLALPAELRAGPAGQRHLLTLAADAERGLAISAARRLARASGPTTLGADETKAALRALSRADSDAELAAALMSWVERRQPAGLAPALDAALAGAAGPPPSFVHARGLLGEGIPAEREKLLLASPSAKQRAAAAAVASPEQAGRLADLLRHDGAPEVRAAALARLARLEGPAALDTLLDAFDDEDGAVRTSAAEHAAAFGPDAVPRLREVAERWPWPASQTAVLALRQANSPESRAVLVELADEHADQRIRTLAALALGRGIGHRH